MKHLAWILASLVISAAALAYALARVDFALLGHELAGANYWLLAPMLVLLTLYYLLTAVNWTLFMRPLGHFSIRQVLPAMMIGFAGNNLFPARLGELARTAVFARQHRRALGAVLVSVMLERLLDVFAILLIYYLALQTIAVLPPALHLGAGVLALVLAPVCLGLALFLWIPERLIRLWYRLSGWLPQHLQERGARLLQGMRHGLTTLRSLPRLLLLACIAMLKWLLAGCVVWLAVAAFQTQLSFSTVGILLAFSSLAVALPSAPGFIGPLQAAFVYALTPFGVSPEVAFASSVFYLVSNWVPTTATGVAGFITLGLKWSDLRRDVQQAEQAAPSGTA